MTPVPLRLWMPAIFLLLVMNLTTRVAYGQQNVSEYAERLRQSTTPENFDSVFSEMITVFKSGKMNPIEDDEVFRVVDIACRKSFSESVLPSVYGWAGTMFGNGRMAKALLYFMESAELYDKQHKHLAQAYSCFEIALIQHKAENYEEASANYTKTLSLGGDSLWYRTKINCYNGFALLERQRKNYVHAAQEFRNAYQTAELNKDTVWMGILAGNIGSIHLIQGSYDSSLFYYFRNLRFIKNTLEFENEIETYTHVGRLYVLKGNYPKAQAYLDSATAIIRERQIHFNDYFNPMDDIHETYALLFAATGDYKRAFEHHSQFHQVALKKQLNVNGRSLKQLESANVFQQKQNEVEFLERINETHLLVIQQQRYITLAFAILIVVIGVWGFHAYKTGRQRKNLNRELVASNSELERLNRIKDKLFSVLSHDLRAPLATLNSIVIFLQDENLEQEDLNALYAGLRHQLEVSDTVLESLLQWAKEELTETKAGFEPVVLANVVDTVALQLKTAIDEKNIHFSNDLNFDVAALANGIQLEIILRNLIANAVKFTPVGGEVSVTGQINEQSVEVHVRDNGMGMHDDEIKTLFEPRKLFSKPGTNYEKGTGIGLFITKEMLAKNGGSIWVSSRENQGTVFTVSLRLAS